MEIGWQTGTAANKQRRSGRVRGVMAIQYTFQNAGDQLNVTAVGFDESLEEVEQYGLSIIQACQAQHCTHVLCNELDLEYRLGTLDTFQAAEYIASLAPRVAKVAVVCNEKFVADARFWENVAVNRGLRVRVFKSQDAAQTWLDDE